MVSKIMLSSNVISLTLEYAGIICSTVNNLIMELCHIDSLLCILRVV